MNKFYFFEKTKAKIVLSSSMLREVVVPMDFSPSLLGQFIDMITELGNNNPKSCHKKLSSREDANFFQTAG